MAMRAETRILAQPFKPETVVSLLDRRIRANHADAIAIIEDLNKHQLVGKLTELIPHLSPEVLLACSAALPFQDLLVQQGDSASTPAIFTTGGDAFSALASALPPAKLRDLFLVASPEQSAQVLSVRCPDQGEAFDLLLSLDLGVELEDAIIEAFEPTSTAQQGIGDWPNTVTTTSTFSPPTAHRTSSSTPFISPRKSPKPAPPHTPKVLTAPAPAAAQASTTPSHPATDLTNAPTHVIAAAAPTVSAGTTAGSQPASRNMPTATALKNRLLQGAATFRSITGSNKVPPATKGKSSHPQKQGLNSSNESDDDIDMEEGSAGDSSDDYAHPKSAAGTESSDDSESSANDDDVPLTTLKKGAKAHAGTAAAASRKLAALDPDFDERAAIYGTTGIPTPGEYFNKHRASIDLVLWEKIRKFPISYTNEDSDPGKWKEKLAKTAPSDSKTVDLPPVPRKSAIAARKKQWGEEYDSIVYHEKQQFFRLPPLVKDLCGDSNNSARHTGDIYVRRFWAPYLYVNVCIQQKKAIQTANTDLVKYTELRFSHLAKPNDHPGSLAEYSRPMKNFFSTVKKRMVERMNGGVREPRVKQEQLDRAISFMGGELRRAAAPALWYKAAGTADIKEQVELRLLEFATEKKLPLDDKDVRNQRLGFQSSEMSRLFRAQPKEVQEKYQRLAEDPNMDPLDFADASAPVLRSFIDAITEETGAIALCAFAVGTSQGPTLVFSQHGDALQSRGWLQGQGTAFLQPFIQAASEVFKVELGNLPLITARPAAPAEKIDHPWTNRASQALVLPPFTFPIAQHLSYNRQVLRSAILGAIRLYSGASPSMESVVEDAESWIVPGTLPERCSIMIDPVSMPTAMVEAWVKHWQESLDENSSLAPESRLTFRGQTVHLNPPPLAAAANAVTQAEAESSKGKGKSKARAPKTPAVAAAAASKPQPRRSGRDVIVEIVPPAGFDRSAYQHHPMQRNQSTPSLPSTSAAIHTRAIQPESAGAAAFAAAPSSTPPGHASRSQSPTGMDIDEAPEAGPSPEPVTEQPTNLPSSTMVPPVPVNPSVPFVPSDQAPGAASSTRTPPRRFHTVPPPDHARGPLVEYSSDPESPLKPRAEGTNLTAPGNGLQLPISTGISATALVAPPIPLAEPQLPSLVPNPLLAAMGLSAAAAVTPEPEVSLPAGTERTAAPSFTLPGPTPGTAASSPTPSSPPVVATGPPDRPPHRNRPRPMQRGPAMQEGTSAPSEGRSLRDAPIVLKEIVSYELSKGQDKTAIEKRIATWKASNPWGMDSFSKFMRIATGTAQFAIRHSLPVLGTLTPLLQAALVTAWYSAAESPTEGKTSRKHRFKLTLPWHNLAAKSPPEFLFQLTLDPTKPLPLLSSLTAADGGWSLPDLGKFMEGLVFSIEVAFNNVAAAPVGLLIHSWVDAVPIARAIALLRSTRSLHNVEAYSGPSLQAIERLTDRTIMFVNAISMVRFLIHHIIQTIPAACDDDAKKSMPLRRLWDRCIATLSTLAESVAAAAASGRTDFFTCNLPETLPQPLVSVAQTVMRHPAWWYQFQEGKTFGPKPLTIQTKNNLLANGLGKWCAALTAHEWNTFSGLDRTLLGILLSMAVLQEVGPGGPKEPTQVKDFTEDLIRIQALVHQSNITPGGEASPLFARDTQATAAGSLDWGSQHKWASCRAAPASALDEVDTDDEELDTFSSGVDQEAIVQEAEAIVEAIAKGHPNHQSPKKAAFPWFKSSAQLFGSSPLSSPGHLSITSSPTRSSHGSHPTIPAAAFDEAAGPPESPALPTIPEGEDPTAPLHPAPEDAVGSGDEDVPVRKRKRAAGTKASKAKRSRTDRSSDAEVPPNQGTSAPRATRSTRKKTENAS